MLTTDTDHEVFVEITHPATDRVVTRWERQSVVGVLSRCGFDVLLIDPPISPNPLDSVNCNGT